MVDQHRLTDDQLACVNAWPESCVALYKMDESLITSINILCHVFSYERICKYLITFEKAWRNQDAWPESLPDDPSKLLTLTNLVVSQEEVDVVILDLHNFCKTHGYGRMSQLAEAFLDMYQDPVGGYTKWKLFHDERMSLMELGFRTMADEETQKES